MSQIQNLTENMYKELKKLIQGFSEKIPEGLDIQSEGLTPLDILKINSYDLTLFELEMNQIMQNMVLLGKSEPSESQKAELLKCFEDYWSYILASLTILEETRDDFDSESV